METVLILGATSDIAIALARHFASEKYHIQLAAREPEKLVPLQADLQIRFQVDCSLFAFDALNYQSHVAFFENLNPKPAITVVVFGVMYLEEDAFGDWEIARRMIDTNFTGAVSILNIVAGHYIAHQNGVIIGISSVAGDRGRASKLLYGSTKAALNAYLAGLRNKCFKENVHVMTVKPGFVYTRMTENMVLPKVLTASPQQVAAAVFKGLTKKKHVVYVKWFWRYIMLIIKHIPEFQFKKMKL